MNDVDIMFFDFSSYLCFLSTLRKLTWTVGQQGSKIFVGKIVLPIRKTVRIPLNNINSMHIHLLPPKNKLHYKIIDSKCGQYYMLPREVLLTQLCRNRIGEIEFNAVSYEHSIHILVRHMISHGIIKFCWINDLFLLSTKVKIDWEYTLLSMKNAGILPSFFALLEYTENLYRCRIINTILKQQQKHYRNCKKSSMFRFLFNKYRYKVNASKLLIALFQLERAKNRIKNNMVFGLICYHILLHLIQSYLPRYLRKKILQIRNNILFTFSFKNKHIIRLPVFNKIVIKSLNGMRIPKTITIKYNKKNGFEIVNDIIVAGYK